MRKNIRKTANLVLSIILSVTALTGCAMPWGGKTEQETVDLDTVQRISYDSSKEYEDALKKYNEGCDSVPVIRDDESLPEKQIVLILQGADDNVLVERAIEQLENHGIKASFAVTAITAAEDDNTVKLIKQKGHELIDNGLTGEGALEQHSDEEIIYSLSASRKVFATLTDFAPNKLLLNDTYYTGNLRMAAKACGYSKIIEPTPGKYLNVKSFANKTKADEYIARIKTGSILVFKLNGIIDALELEPKVEWKKPAIDPQPSLKTSKGEEDEKDVITVLEWLLDAIESQGCKVVKPDALKALTEEEYVASLLKDNAGLLANEYSKIETMEKVATIAFKGVSENVDDMQAIVEVLREVDASATFFLNGDDIDNRRDSVDTILDGGFSVACRESEDDDFAGKDVYDIYVKLNTAVRKIHKDISLKPRYFMPEGKASDNLRCACSIAGLGIVPFYTGLRNGNGEISCVDLTKDVNVEKIKNFITENTRSKIKLVDVTTLLKTANSVPDIDEETLRAFRETNEGKLAYQRNMIYTSEKAMSMIFYGVSNKKVLDDVLSILSSWGYKGTFFVTLTQLSDCDEQIKKILDNGHEIGIAYLPKADTESTFDYVAEYILSAQKYAQWKYEIDTNLFFQPYGEISDETKEAVSATGCALVGHEYALVQSKYQDATSVGSFYGAISGKIDAHRGSIAYFNMDYFTADKELEEEDTSTLLGSLLKKFISSKIRSLTYTDVYGNVAKETSYKVKTFSALAHSAYVYSPGRSSSSKVSGKNNVMGVMQNAVQQNYYMAQRYIGNMDVSVIPGFTDEELKMFDVSGKVTSNKVLFLTFDDWGYEKDINELLYVLNKYGVKANFFVRTNNVANNPNLLRAIAMDGHMIGSHSNSHMPAWYVAEDGQGNYLYGALTDDDSAVLREDVVKSYSILNKYCGDVAIGGKKALSTIYRPPTLAVSRPGMYQIYDVGYTYIVNGDFSSLDYEAASVNELVNELLGGRDTWYGKMAVGNGTCLIMHMSPNAKFTAEALDIMIPWWQDKGYTFARLDDYLH